MNFKFYEFPLAGDEAYWCVDGRPDSKNKKGPQMLGGVLHPLLLLAIETGQELDEAFVRTGIDRLEVLGVKVGAHRGSHRNAENGACDCGFCDKMRLILDKVRTDQSEIEKRLIRVYEQNKDKFGVMDKPFGQMLNTAFDKLNNYASGRVKVTGEPLLKTIEDTGATIGNVEGDHAERVAFVNLKPKYTYDTNTASDDGNQAFNLDLWAVMGATGKLEIDPEFAMAASLILYQATEMVLVEDKGKPALGVLVHS